MEQKLRKLEETLATYANNPSPNLNAPDESEQTSDGTLSATETLEDDESTFSEKSRRLRIVIDLESSQRAPAPSHYLHLTASTQPRTHHDIISRGVISIENAHIYFDDYHNQLDHFVYSILGDHGSMALEDIRDVSPFLMTAICAVGALHLASPDFDELYRECVALSASLSFVKNTVEDVQALLIAAFWMSDLSWTWVGLAVRIATELQLHRSFPRAILGDREQYSNTRLYYLVYVCDHHFSIPYGRPPTTRECEAVRDARMFLDCEHATEDDARLISQVFCWSICSSIYDAFGADVDRPLSEAQISDVRRFSISLDSLRAEWADIFGPNAHVGNYPRKGVGVRYHFAKLYLCSHALRGARSVQARSRSPDVVADLDEIANSAVLSALSILRAVILDSEMQSYLSGLPAYFHIMIAFAAVFLLKVSTRVSSSIMLDIPEVKLLMNSLVVIMKNVTATMHSRHILVTITKAVEELLQRSRMAPEQAAVMSTTTGMKPRDAITDAGELHGEIPTAGDEMFGELFINEYDLLLGLHHGWLP
ncbi:fungal specific transcription factor domain-containing protein [Aspergillus tanneri]|nr:uncharacterized protein ATNIH1004_007182 [Aspergillus tanneri]KAA8645763.1 hypothetical protein ATNIH1004_007182 [Aspergillus tanneri]